MTLLYVLLLVLAVCPSGSEAQRSSEPCQENQPPVKNSEPLCLHDKFMDCAKQLSQQQIQINPLITSCFQGCANILGPNSTGIISCLEEYKAEKLLQKMKQSDCILSESAQTANFQQNVVFPKTINISEMIKYKMEKNFVSAQIPLKMYEQCQKDCIKRGTPKIKGAKKSKMLEKDLAFQQCYMQAFQKPYMPNKGSKYVSKLCSEKLKSDKYLLSSKLSECIKSTMGEQQLQQNVQDSESSSFSYERY